MKKQYRVSLDVNCGGNYYDALDFYNRLLGTGFEEEALLLTPIPEHEINGRVIKRHYLVSAWTTSDVKKRLIKYFKLKKDLCYDGTPMRSFYRLEGLV